MYAKNIHSIKKMKYYIDFDHTLYSTNDLITDMIDCIAKYILEKGNFKSYPQNFKKLFPNIELIKIDKNIDTIKKILKDNFGRPKDTVLKIPYNIFSLVKHFSELFNCDYFQIEALINKTLDDGQKYLYDDSIPFLSKLKSSKNEVYILSHEGNDLKFQVQKIKGSGILHKNFIDAAIITKESKAALNAELLRCINKTSIIYVQSNRKTIESIDYTHGIFIDDRPKDLNGLYQSLYKYETPPFKARLYRMKRENGTYSKLPVNILYKNGIIEISNFNTL